VYRLQLMNTTERVQHYRIRASGLEGLRTDIDATVIAVDPAEARWVPVAARVAPETAAAAGRGSHPIDFTVERIVDTPDDTARSVVERSTFVVPR
ncbi:MAG TPA: FixG Ig-like domain-containing protein, partial [Rubrivivax sp.]|nr:FixG Ig-like domain-containing protein [Rubrivivax sp.]